MAEHLTRETIDAFGRGTLAPAALLAVDDHLASCEACRCPGSSVDHRGRHLAGSARPQFLH